MYKQLCAPAPAGCRELGRLRGTYGKRAPERGELDEAAGATGTAGWAPALGAVEPRTWRVAERGPAGKPWGGVSAAATRACLPSRYPRGHLVDGGAALGEAGLVQVAWGPAAQEVGVCLQLPEEPPPCSPAGAAVTDVY